MWSQPKFQPDGRSEISAPAEIIGPYVPPPPLPLSTTNALRDHGNRGMRGYQIKFPLANVFHLPYDRGW